MSKCPSEYLLPVTITQDIFQGGDEYYRGTRINITCYTGTINCTTDRRLMIARTPPSSSAGFRPYCDTVSTPFSYVSFKQYESEKNRIAKHVYFLFIKITNLNRIKKTERSNLKPERNARI